MKILILGGNGMLGHKLHQVLAKRHDVQSTIRGTVADHPRALTELLPRRSLLERLDATDARRLADLLKRQSPDVLINCVGVIKQRPAAKDAIQSITTNALLPHQLAEMASDHGVRLIHFSTDCVFSGDRGDYREDDFPDARDLYGRTKSLGEVGEPALTIRTSIIGPELEHFQSLVEWFLQQTGTVRGFNHVTYSGLTTFEMARVVDVLLREHQHLSGVYHVASSKISKYELLQLVRDAFGLDTDVMPDEEVVSDRSLVADRFSAATGIEIPSWPRMITEMAEDMKMYAGVRSDSQTVQR